MDDEEKEIVGCLGAIGMLSIIPITAIVRGYILSIIWSWFMVPLGIIPIGIAHAIGISVTVSFLTSHLAAEDKEKSTTTKVVTKMFSGVLVSLMALGIAWIAHRFM